MTIYCRLYQLQDHNRYKKLNVLNPLLPFQRLSYPNALVYTFINYKSEGSAVNRQYLVNNPETSKNAVSGIKGLTTAQHIKNQCSGEIRANSVPLFDCILRDLVVDVDRTCVKVIEHLNF